ncbi:MAG TPA: Fic family protein [Bacteroidales bacterium]|nr:Fic family protein [Bacteroidales bacterium]
MKKPEAPPVIKKQGLERIVKLLKEREYSDLVRSYNDDYLYWTELKYKPKPENIGIKDVWFLVKLSRRLNSQVIKISNIEGFRFQYFLTSQIQQKLHEFDLNLGGRLENDRLIPKEEKVKFLLSSIMEEAIASSQIEGAVTTRRVAKDMLRSERRPVSKSEQMIMNNYHTIKRISELRNTSLSPSIILEIHKLITTDTLENKGDEGRFRTNNEINVVDGVTGEPVWVPPDYNNLELLIDNFCAFANEKNENNFIHPIIRASILHFLMGYIHPFVDGNGRTARAIFYWYLLKQDYWLIEYLSISRLIVKSKDQYANAYLFTELDENDLTYFIKYHIRTIDLAFNSLKDYISRKLTEKTQIYNYRRINGLNDRQLHLLRLFHDDPERVLTIKEVQNRYGVVYQTARTDLMLLEKLDLIKSTTSGKKKLVYIRSGDFETVLKKLCR